MKLCTLAQLSTNSLQDTKMTAHLRSIPSTANLTLDVCCQLLQQGMLEPAVMDIVVKRMGGFPRQAWCHLNPCQHCEALSVLVGRHLPFDLLHDKQLMIKFCANENALDLILHDLKRTPLIEDCEVSQVVVSADCCALCRLPWSAQTLHPDLVVCSVKHAENKQKLADALREEAFLNHEVALAWIQHACNALLSVDFFDIHQQNEQIMLALIEVETNNFQCVSDKFRGDKSFSCKAVAQNGDVWLLLDDKWKEDHDVCLTAFGGQWEHVNHRGDCSLNDVFVLSKFRDSVQNKIDEHDKFVKFVLGSIDVPGAGCPFQLLSQGEETSLICKRLIAECTGAPTGPKLQELRQAAAKIDCIQKCNSWNLKCDLFQCQMSEFLSLLFSFNRMFKTHMKNYQDTILEFHSSSRS